MGAGSGPSTGLSGKYFTTIIFLKTAFRPEGVNSINRYTADKN